jgi:hypothetical protein
MARLPAPQCTLCDLPSPPLCQKAGDERELRDKDRQCN